MRIDEVTDWWDDDNNRRFRRHERNPASLKPLYYWSYGMLCDPANMQHPGAKMIGRAYLQGYELELLSHANVIQGRGMFGTLWQINFNVLKKLDIVEGYPNYYKRIVQPVKTGAGSTVQAQIYVMTDESRDHYSDSMPQKKYIRSIRDGYKAAQIPIQQLVQAIQNLEDRLLDRQNISDLQREKIANYIEELHRIALGEN